MQDIISEVNKHGFFPDEIIPDGEIRRFKRTASDKHLDAWYAAYENHTSKGDTFYVYVGGDWREPGRIIKILSNQELSINDKKIIDSQIQDTKFQIEIEKEQLKKQCEVECQTIWAESGEFTDTEYTIKKKIKGDFKVKTKGKVVMVPVKTIDDKLVGLQKIYPDGKKFFHPGTAKKGSFHLIGPHINGETYICEGFATGASIHMATGKPVVVAFDAGNLVHVAKAVRSKFKETKIIICGDDDKWTKDNPGKTFAEKAAQEVKGSVVFPKFSVDIEGHTDFNDLHTSEGLDRLEEELSSGVAKPTPAIKKPVKILETSVVERLVGIYGDNLIKKNGDFFVYQNGVWKFLTDDELGLIKNQIMSFYGSDAKSKDAESTFKAFSYKIKIAPIEMFKPNPYCVNFLNGTFHISKNKDQSWSKEFRSHNREDYLINQLCFNYNPDNKEQNTEFLDMLDRVFDQDSDKTEKILAIKQMYGACLIPAFPHLFMLHGKAGTGKTTVILPLYEFLKESNISSVEPYQFQGFAMESMAGKLVNIVTDIDTKKPIEDANIKKIEDRVPVRIDRKYKNAIYAPLPAIHIFGGNDIPPTLDGSSGAHVRRWTFIEFKSFQASGFYDKSFASHVFNGSPRGILNFALEGLDELLLSRGHFINPSSGKEKIVEWMTMGDVVQQFLDDIGNFEVENSVGRMIIFDKNSKINRVELYAAFSKWYDEAGHNKMKKNCTRNAFYSALHTKKYDSYDSNGLRLIAGFGLKVRNSSAP